MYPRGNGFKKNKRKKKRSQKGDVGGEKQKGGTRGITREQRLIMGNGKWKWKQSSSLMISGCGRARRKGGKTTSEVWAVERTLIPRRAAPEKNKQTNHRR